MYCPPHPSSKKLLQSEFIRLHPDLFAPRRTSPARVSWRQAVASLSEEELKVSQAVLDELLEADRARRARVATHAESQPAKVKGRVCWGLGGGVRGCGLVMQGLFGWRPN